MAPIDTINHINYQKLNKEEREALRKAFEEKKKRLQEAISAIDNGLRQL
jgi:hypothetical protein